MEEDWDKPFVRIYTGLALRRGERKRGLSTCSTKYTNHSTNVFYCRLEFYENKIFFNLSLIKNHDITKELI